MSSTRTLIHMPQNVSQDLFAFRLVVLTTGLAHSLSWYRFIGRILGKALYEGILVDVAFAGFFLAKVSRGLVRNQERR